MDTLMITPFSSHGIVAPYSSISFEIRHHLNHFHPRTLLQEKVVTTVFSCKEE